MAAAFLHLSVVAVVVSLLCTGQSAGAADVNFRPVIGKYKHYCATCTARLKTVTETYVVLEQQDLNGMIMIVVHHEHHARPSLHIFNTPLSYLLSLRELSRKNVKPHHWPLSLFSSNTATCIGDCQALTYF